MRNAERKWKKRADLRAALDGGHGKTGVPTCLFVSVSVSIFNPNLRFHAFAAEETFVSAVASTFFELISL